MLGGPAEIVELSKRADSAFAEARRLACGTALQVEQTLRLPHKSATRNDATLAVLARALTLLEKARQHGAKPDCE
jgi:hypothetical protein